MSKEKRVYPPENVQVLDENSEKFIERARREICRKYRIDATTLENLVIDLGEKLAPIMSPEYIGTRPTGSGFNAVDYDHFRKLENLRLRHFLQAVFIDADACNYADHELSLMILEIKELRAVLLRQFNYNWREHRKNFPLIAQTVI